jgi:hypothetical protein
MLLLSEYQTAVGATKFDNIGRNIVGLSWWSGAGCGADLWLMR